jgi:hypothetical protein
VADRDSCRELGEAAWSWVTNQVQDRDGPWLPENVSVDQPQLNPAESRDSLYVGIAGLTPLLCEIAQYRPLTDAEQHLATRVVARLRAQTAVRTEACLYAGLAGDAMALKLLDPGREATVLERLTYLQTPAGWPSTFDFEGTGGRTRRCYRQENRGCRRHRDRGIPPPPHTSHR